ncbi:putative CENP-V/GFA domain-containing protein [Seiridium cardinale]
MSSEVAAVMSSTGMTPPDEIKTLCYCGSLHYNLQLPVDVLPFSATMCHCGRCRYTYGALATAHATIPKNNDLKFIGPPSLTASVTPYRSKGANFDDHYFRTCGCHMGCHSEAENTWSLSIALWPPNIGDRCLKATSPAHGRAELPVVDEVGSDGKERLRAQYDCAGISFTIPRPTDEVLADPYLNGYVSPLNTAITDACNDCRLLTDVRLNTLAYVPLKLIEPRIEQSLRHGRMKRYASSPGNVRTFCYATVLGMRIDTINDNDVANIATGLFRASEGVCAEKLVHLAHGRARLARRWLRILSGIPPKHAPRRSVLGFSETWPPR